MELKGLEYESQYVHLLRDGGEQHTKEHLKRNPMRQLPVLTAGGNVVSQSVAILEYLEENYPDPALLPSGLEQRAKVRELVQLVNSGIQPLQNLSVIQDIQKRWDFPRSEAIRWCHDWIQVGLEALELITTETAGAFSYKDAVGMADCCLIPQLYNARRFGIDTSVFPTLHRIESHCGSLEAFQNAHPEAQGDFPKDAQ